MFLLDHSFDILFTSTFAHFFPCDNQVNNKYVVNKLARILYPMGKGSWERKEGDDQLSGAMDSGGVSENLNT